MKTEGNIIESLKKFVELFYKRENIEDRAEESGIRKYLCYLWLIGFLIRLKREEARLRELKK